MVNRGGAGTVFKPRALVLGLLFLIGAGFLLKHDASLPPATHENALNPGHMLSAFGKLPIIFEPNQGQADSRIKFLAHGSGYGLNLAPAEAVVSFPRLSRDDQSGSALQMQLMGASQNSQIAALDRLPGRSNYFVGNDPSRWLHNVPQFARVQYEEIYPGIDLAFYGKQGQIEYDFDVKPGADPHRIELAFRGSKNVSISENGDLVLGLEGRELRFKSPRVYQNSTSGQQTVAGSFVLRGNNRAGFEIGNYDRNRELIIDPVLAFSSYLGGSGDESCSAIAVLAFVPHCPAIAIDSASRIYVAGATTSSALFSGATVPAVNGGADVFISRLVPSGSSYTLDYVTYLGGSGREYPAGVGVDSGFNAYVAGTTNSGDFPTTVGAFQSGPLSTADHVFVSKLDSSGSANLYSTYLSGTGTDTASSLALDNQGRVYLIGITNSPDFPHTAGALQLAPAAANQFFVSKVDPSASGTNSLPYSTYIGGSTPSGGIVAGGGIAVDSGANVYLVGGTTFIDMPLDNAFQTTNAGGFDVWAARLNAPANNTQQYTPNFETYLGGSGDDIAYGVATDPSSTVNMYITGETTSSDITPVPAVASGSPFPKAHGAGADAFIAKFGALLTTGTNSGKVPLNYFTYLGGSGADRGLAIIADSTQNARVVGSTSSGDFPAINNPVQGGLAGGLDAFYARILTTGVSSATSSSSTFLGGSGNDLGTSVAVDPALNSYIGGETSSATAASFNVNSIQGSRSGPTDVFVSKLGASVSLSMPNPTVNPGTVAVGNQVKFVYSIFNNGDPLNGAVFTDNIAANSSSVTASTSVGNCGATVGTTLTCNLGTLPTSTSSTTAAATITVTVNVAVPSSTASSSQIGNSGTLTVSGTGFTQTAANSATVNDFSVAASPASASVIAGAGAPYIVAITPTGAGFPSSVSLACGSGLPSQGSCAFTGSNPIPNMNGPGSQSRALQINTAPRVTTTSSIFHPGGLMYAVWLSLFGVGGIGLIGTGICRKRKILLGLFTAAIAAIVIAQAGCGSSSKTTTTTTGTPAGTYTVTINATSGSATRTTTVQLTVR
jgi:hypothetical protein